MSADASSPATRSFSSKLFWIGAGVLALAFGSAALSVHQAQGSVEGTGALAMTTPAATEPNRIDHRQVDWDKHPATPDDPGASIAAYSLGSVESTGSLPMTMPAETEPNRIDHRQVDWDKHPAMPDDPGASIAAYGFGG